MAAGQIISLGSIGVDVEQRSTNWPPFGSSVISQRFLLAGGGKAANVAYLAARLGATAQLIGHLGDDDLAAIALRLLKAVGADLGGTKAIAGCATGFAVILVRPDGEKAIVAANNANDVWSDGDIQDAISVLSGDVERTILVADIDIPTHVVERVAGAARERGMRIILDPSPPERLTETLYLLADYLTPDHVEAEQLTGIAVTSPESAFQAADVLVGRGVGTALVKLEHGGCVVVGPGIRSYLPSTPTDAVDSTGAGDAFAGGLAVALAEGQPVLDAARFAVAAATLKVQSYGAQTWQPTREDIVAVMRRNG